MALYFTSNTNMTTPVQVALSSTIRTQTGIFSKAAASGITNSRFFIYEFEVGTNSLPHSTDCPVEWDCVVATTTGAAVTCFINPLDPADAASSHDSFINHSAEGATAVTSQRWQLSANQRASYRWVVNPGGPGELVGVSATSNGLCIRAKSGTYTGFATAAVYFRE